MPTGGWSGLWNHVEKKQHELLTPTGFNTSGGTVPVRGHAIARRIARITKSPGGRIASERVFIDLNEDYKQVVASNQPGNPIVNGGLIPIAITDFTPVSSFNFVDMVEKASVPTSYPADKSGNGGGGKMGLKL
jgi:hypothetical protein